MDVNKMIKLFEVTKTVMKVNNLLLYSLLISKLSSYIPFESVYIKICV